MLYRARKRHRGGKIDERGFLGLAARPKDERKKQAFTGGREPRPVKPPSAGGLIIGNDDRFLRCSRPRPFTGYPVGRIGLLEEFNLRNQSGKGGSQDLYVHD